MAPTPLEQETRDTHGRGEAPVSEGKYPVKKPIHFGKYLLLERVNVGGMAEIYKAKAYGVEGFERLLAVKRILPSIAEDQEFITMFVDEAKIAVQLTHANIAQIFDLGKVVDSYFIAMEFIHGKDVRALFELARRRAEPLPIPMSCYIAMKICEGLDYAHNKKDASGGELNLVHRDVSPQNILVSYEGEVKLIDFGIAKAAGKVGKTQAGILKGKFGYMSPEQVRGLPLDRRSDVFAVGIILYELLTGERLFSGETDFSTLEKVRNVEIMPPSTYNRNVADELEQIVLKALAKDVEDRYQTAMDLHDHLQSYMYTSSNFYSRKDLSSFMKSSFEDDIVRESNREDEYRKMEAAGGLSASDETRGTMATQETRSGLEAFDEIPGQLASSPSIQIIDDGPSTLSVIQQQSKGRMSAPPPPPRSSIPPSRVPSNPPRTPSGRPLPRNTMPLTPAVPRQSVPPSNPPRGASVQMEWDDEELSTQIYDKPELGITGGPLPSSPGGLLGRSGEGPSYAPPIAPPPGIGSGFGIAPPPSAPPPAAGMPSIGPSTYTPSPSFPRPGDPTPLMNRTQPMAPPARRSFAGLAIGLVALLAIAAGAYFMLRPRTGTITLRTVPTDATVLIDGAPVEGTRSPFILSAVSSGRHLLEVRRDGYSPWRQPIEVRPGAPLELPEIALEPETTTRESVGTGFALASNPAGATVFVDGQQMAERTPVRLSNLQPGTYSVRVENGPNYEPWQGSVTVSAGQLVELPAADLRLRRARVSFDSNPSGVELTLVRGRDRLRLGPTPVAREIDVAGGPWTVEARQRGYENFDAPLLLAGNAFEQRFAAELRSSTAEPTEVRRPPPDRVERPNPPAEARPPAATGTGQLAINTRPWSQVTIDGRSVGNTPLRGIELPAGRHRVVMTNPEFNLRQEQTVTIRPGETERLIVTLTT